MSVPTTNLICQKCWSAGNNMTIKEQTQPGEPMSGEWKTAILEVTCSSCGYTKRIGDFSYME